jgi:hypothetical protein
MHGRISFRMDLYPFSSDHPSGHFPERLSYLNLVDLFLLWFATSGLLQRQPCHAINLVPPRFASSGICDQQSLPASFNMMHAHAASPSCISTFEDSGNGITYLQRFRRHPYSIKIRLLLIQLINPAYFVTP